MARIVLDIDVGTRRIGAHPARPRSPPPRQPDQAGAPEPGRPDSPYRVEWPEATVGTRPGWSCGGPRPFGVQLDLEAREADEPPWARSWHRRIPRRLT